MTIAAIPLTSIEDRLLNSPLTVEHRRELSAARDRSKAIRKTASVASFNGWATAIIAAISAPFSIFSPVGLAVTAGLAIVAFVEFRGRKRLLNFDPRGASLLGWNQVGFLAMITVYCLWMMYSNLNGNIDLPPELQGADVNAFFSEVGGLETLYKQIVIYFYGSVIALSALFQGGTALYYFSRRRLVEQFVAETPAWIRDVHRET